MIGEIRLALCLLANDPYYKNPDTVEMDEALVLFITSLHMGREQGGDVEYAMRQSRELVDMSVESLRERQVSNTSPE